MAGHALLFITGGIYAKVVQQVLLPGTHDHIMPRDLNRLALPGKVGGMHYLLA
jgi:hypothetical protein